MPVSQRERSRLYRRDIRKIHDPVPADRYSHARYHKPRALVYTSASATLDLTAGSPFYVYRQCRLVRMRVNVAGVTSSTLTCDLLKDGASVFPSGFDKPTIASGAKYGKVEIVGLPMVFPDSYLQVQLTATGSATGPLVAYIELLEET